jgi:uncharacterized protein YeaO (DUF488 family)
MLDQLLAEGAGEEATSMIRIKRTYEPPARGDGRRILVERLWPRGMKKEALAADAWIKEVAPSTKLRKWFDHREERWEEFRRRYRQELNANSDAWKGILDASRRRTVTLLYSAHDTLHNGALVLRDYLMQRAAGSSRIGKQAAQRLASKKKSSAPRRTRNSARG